MTNRNKGFPPIGRFLTQAELDALQRGRLPEPVPAVRAMLEKASQGMLPLAGRLTQAEIDALQRMRPSEPAPDLRVVLDQAPQDLIPHEPLADMLAILKEARPADIDADEALMALHEDMTRGRDDHADEPAGPQDQPHAAAPPEPAQPPLTRIIFDDDGAVSDEHIDEAARALIGQDVETMKASLFRMIDEVTAAAIARGIDAMRADDLAADIVNAVADRFEEIARGPSRAVH